MTRDLAIEPGLVIRNAYLSYETMRAGGPGGQHVNTASTAVRLRFNLEDCADLASAVKARLSGKVRVTDSGEVLIHSGKHRSQSRNIEEVRERLAELVRSSLVAPPRRRPTRKTRGSVRRRLEGKKKRGETKRMRGKVRD